MRLLALAQAYLDARGLVHWAFAELPGTVQNRLAGEGISLHRIDEPPGSPGDARATGAVARAVGAEWLAVDGYHFDAEYQHAAKGSGVSLLVLDDLGEQPFYPADIVVNQNVHAETLSYQVPPSTKLLLGPRYALLRREFLSLRETLRPVSDRVEHILVTFGGSDPDNLTGLALGALATLRLAETTIHVVLGGANPHREELSRLAAQLPSRVNLLYDVRDMPQLMATADLALAAAGVTALELALCGVPAVLCAIATNQEAALQAMEERGTAISIGPAHCTSADIIRTAVLRLLHDPDMRRSLSARSLEMVDGGGVWRVLDAMFPAAGFPVKQDSARDE